jgi:thiamine kinase-like enzyme
MTEFKELKGLAKNIMEEKLYKLTVIYLENAIKNMEVSRNVIIHRDIRPENVLYKNGKYYLLDFESMCVGDRDYDFIRMFNIFNQKMIYQYEDFKTFMDGYKSTNEIDFSVEKWDLYSKYYAFKMYTRMLSGKVSRNNEFERYLRSILEDKNDRITEWIKKYNKEELIMMKRYFAVHFFTCLVLGFAVGSWMVSAVLRSNIFYGVLAILAVIALVLNVICVFDEIDNSNEDEE